MTHEHCSPSCSHAHCNEEDFDPCLAEEIAIAEKNRVLYEKLKLQSDRILHSAGIRINQSYRVRRAVAFTNEEECAQSEGSDSEDGSTGFMVEEIAIEKLSFYLNINRSIKIFIYTIPCDIALTDKDVCFDEFQLNSKKFNKSNNLKFLNFSKSVCVCNKCPKNQKSHFYYSISFIFRLSGTLGSIAMLLKQSPCVVAIRNGGLCGLWNSNSQQSMHSFIEKMSNE